jgi:hypothetical protein
MDTNSALGGIYEDTIFDDKKNTDALFTQIKRTSRRLQCEKKRNV